MSERLLTGAWESYSPLHTSLLFTALSNYLHPQGGVGLLKPY